MITQVKTAYDRMARSYDRCAEAGGWNGPELLASAVAPHAANPEKILDIGSGTGLLAALFKKIYGPETQIVALDLSLEMLKAARGQQRADMFIQGNGESLPFADNSFDLVTSCATLNYVPDLQAFASEALRVARSGAPIGITFDSEHGLYASRRTRRPCSVDSVIAAFDKARLISCTPFQAQSIFGPEQSHLLIAQAP